MTVRPFFLSLLQRASKLSWIERRLWRAQPAEILLLEILGGRAFMLPCETSPKHPLPLLFVWWMPRIFRREKVRHAVWVGRRRVSFGNDICRGILIDGAAYQRDILLQLELDDFFQKRDWRVLHIVGSSLQRDPRAVRSLVRAFLTS
jgi:hypothetical protein